MSGFRWESVEEHHLRRFFSHFRVDCVFDVGANRGQYRDIIRRHVGYNGIIISFEPIPELVSYLLQKRSELNDHNWYIEGCALDENEGMADFKIMANDVFSSLKQPTVAEINIFSVMNSVEQVVKVNKETLAMKYAFYKTLLGFERPFLKMDTQGNDISVFKGAGPARRDFVGLQSELSLRRIYENSPIYYEAIEFYRTSGFQISALVPNNAGHFPNLVEIDCIMYRVDL